MVFSWDYIYQRARYKCTCDENKSHGDWLLKKIVWIHCFIWKESIEFKKEKLKTIYGKVYPESNKIEVENYCYEISTM